MADFQNTLRFLTYFTILECLFNFLFNALLIMTNIKNYIHFCFETLYCCTVWLLSYPYFLFFSQKRRIRKRFVVQNEAWSWIHMNSIFSISFSLLSVLMSIRSAMRWTFHICPSVSIIRDISSRLIRNLHIKTTIFTLLKIGEKRFQSMSFPGKVKLLATVYAVLEVKLLKAKLATKPWLYLQKYNSSNIWTINWGFLFSKRHRSHSRSQLLGLVDNRRQSWTLCLFHWPNVVCTSFVFWFRDKDVQMVLAKY